MTWKYSGEYYMSTPMDWQRVHDARCLMDVFLEVWHPVKIPTKNTDLFDILVYHIKWDKCFTIQRFGTMGNGNKLKMCLEDIYTKKHYYCQAKDVELVTKIVYE